MPSKKKNKPSAFNGKFDAIKVKLINSKNTVADLSTLKYTTSLHNVKSLIQSLTSHPVLKKLILGETFPESFEALTNNKGLYFTNVSQEISWNVGIISLYKNEINDFLKLKKAYSNFVLNGNLDEAGQILEDVKAKYGYSLWYLENQIGLLTVNEGLEAEKKFSQSIVNNESIDDFVRFLAEYFSVRGEKNVSTNRFTHFFEDFVQMAKKADADINIVEFLRYKLFKLDLNQGDDTLASILNQESNFSLIDRFVSTMNFYSAQKARYANEQGVKYSNNFLENFLLSETKENDQDSVFSTAYSCYIRGETKQCCKICQDQIISELCDWRFYELFAITASLTEVGELLGRINDFKYSILENLHNCYHKIDSVVSSYDWLNKTSLIFSTLTWSYKLDIFLLRDFSNYFFDKNNQVLYNESFLGTNYDLFFNYQTNSFFEDIDFPLISETYEKIREVNDFNKSDGYISFENYNALLGIIEYENGQFDISIQYLKKIPDENTNCFHIKFKGIINNLIRLFELNEAIDFAVGTYLKNTNVFSLIPFNILIPELLDDSNESLRKNISCPILLEIYYRHYDTSSITFLKEAYQDFMSFHSVDMPSNVINLTLDADIKKIVYFLEFICVPEVMEIDVINFNSSDAINRERINICRLLAHINKEKSETYSEEINNITQTMMISSSLQSIEKSKIYVDTIGLLKIAENEYRELFNRYISILKSAPGLGDFNETKYLTIFENEEGITFKTPTTNKDSLFWSIFTSIRNDFLFNNLYGLDVALSVDIRHGILIGKLRSKFEQAKLITQKNNNGIYLPNHFWQNRLGFMDDSEKDSILKHLDDFSHAIDDQIDFLNDEKMQVKIENRNLNGLFDFHIIIDESFVRFQSNITVEATFEEFITRSFSQLWRMTDENLEFIRHYLVTDYKEFFNDHFEKLLNSLSPYNYNNRLEELISSIIELRTVVTNELYQISSWFTRSKSANTPDYRFSFLIDLGEHMIKNHYPDIQLVINRNIEDNSIFLKGSTLKSLSDVLFILLNNIITHSNLDDNETKLVFKVTELNEVEMILSNKTATNDDFDKINTTLINITSSLSVNNSYNQVRMQGGTGFYKLDKIFRVNLGTDYKLSVQYVNATQFEVKLFFNIGKIRL